MSSQGQANAIIAFIESIGIGVDMTPLAQPTFLPGIVIRHGRLAIDPDKWRYPGDLVHEAGHLAVMSPAERAQAHGELDPDGGMEMAALAWSYAAARAMRLPLEVLFHDAGYKGDARWLRDHFIQGGNLGVPLLDYFGMTLCPARLRRLPQMPHGQVFPHMVHWLRER
ncbi:hypothetical protein [Modicisalibacter coralii]|uniref:hypothetical protein n=1 Tax=Modicisalibacter coralii TaxID=2304602 RepID=UPI0019397C6B|nr:hypothetical protein [Halomonas coralii]